MRADISDLLTFYKTPLGQVVSSGLKKRLQLQEGRVLGIGFPCPLLDSPSIVMMPAGQGAIPWEGQSVTLGEETNLPFKEESFSDVVIIHSLESSSSPLHVLREVWRVLKPTGHLHLFLPNRRSLWSRLETTPFAHGEPYSLGQGSRLLTSSLFTPCHQETLIFTPPSSVLLSLSWIWEKVGPLCLKGLGGVLYFQAIKQVYCGIYSSQKVKKRLSPAWVLRYNGEKNRS